MITLSRIKFAGVLAAALGSAHWLADARAQNLHDPMQPPAFAAPASGAAAGAGGGEQSSGALVLQSTLMSGGRRIAMIGGKPMKVGERIGAATIIAIEPASVTLREGATTRVLKLYQGVEITRPPVSDAVPNAPLNSDQARKAPRIAKGAKKVTE